VAPSAPLAAAKRHLLAMLGGTAPPPLPDAAWSAIAAMAGQHRLEPLLAYRLDHAAEAWPVPPALAERWRSARRGAGLASLALQAALRAAAAALDREAIPFSALKGPRLAWRCYPEPGLRPMRDLDLLVAEDAVLRAAEVLARAGFAAAAGPALLRQALARDKHLPPLLHPALNVAVELHHRVSDPPGRHGYRVPQLDPAAILAQSQTVDLGGLAAPCPAPEDLLAHLMLHALYGHRLDCGPLVLADIHYLLAGEAIDPAGFWTRAEAGGWVRGAGLLLALAERHFGPQPLRPRQPPPQPMLAAAEEALLQDLDSRDHAEALADVLAARSPRALAAALAGRLRPGAEVVAAEGGGRPLWRFWPVWAWRRLRRLLTRLGNRRVRDEAGSAAELLRWLQS